MKKIGPTTVIKEEIKSSGVATITMNIPRNARLKHVYAGDLGGAENENRVKLEFIRDGQKVFVLKDGVFGGTYSFFTYEPQGIGLECRINDVLRLQVAGASDTEVRMVAIWEDL